MYYQDPVSGLEIKVKDFEKIHVKVLLKFLVAKHHSGKLRCPALYYSKVWFASPYNLLGKKDEKHSQNVLKKGRSWQHVIEVTIKILSFLSDYESVWPEV